MGGQNYQTVLAEGTDNIAETDTFAGVQSGSGLVEHENFRIV